MELDPKYCDVRITPACAGNRVLPFSIFGSAKDHPRLRGEQHQLSVFICPEQGSPPLARGTVYRFAPGDADFRITPACAGNSSRYRKTGSSPRDHPRLRGEQGACRPCFIVALGSPPLARGTVCRGSRPPSIRRITPACAGNRLHRRQDTARP